MLGVVVRIMMCSCPFAFQFVDRDRARRREGAKPRAWGVTLRGLHGICMGQAELFDRDFPHLELLDLPRDRGWEFRCEPDVSRNLVRGDLAAAEVAELICGRLLSLMQSNPGA